MAKNLIWIICVFLVACAMLLIKNQRDINLLLGVGNVLSLDILMERKGIKCTTWKHLKYLYLGTSNFMKTNANPNDELHGDNLLSSGNVDVDIKFLDDLEHTLDDTHGLAGPTVVVPNLGETLHATDNAEMFDQSPSSLTQRLLF